jgi:hypothetical protein
MAKQYKIGSKYYEVGSFAQAIKATPKKTTVAKKAAAKKPTIGGAAPRVTNTTGFTNRSSGYLNPNAAGNKKSTTVKKVASVKRKRGM